MAVAPWPTSPSDQGGELWPCDKFGTGLCSSNPPPPTCPRVTQVKTEVTEQIKKCRETNDNENIAFGACGGGVGTASLQGEVLL